MATIIHFISPKVSLGLNNQQIATLANASCLEILDKVTVVEKLKKLNQNYTGGYIKKLYQVDGLLPLSSEVNIDDEIKKLKDLNITPMFANIKLPGTKIKSNALCVRDINGNSNSEKVNKIAL